ncbi:hypothetical protein A2715_05325 [Candidatus Woesebacteria bacterium RIFCSPHIGHO2_01_FULL_39_32]|uniref:POTRA domain-containing protein n=1 Tax=Candidatus Woesebacteria bacterium RIFCSPLOWO2_01_FULL_39_25 TaxID=1802521 RepID=A0A1F8BLL3_9BACT|nr:MAG: hypothetical protein A2124_04290 [Candidatus Woesebacteria bacterium GWB1_37_5]OGM25440.1 MAG: hypothetical protein A2715_05325 [Candidatus Woesebacteria bacterium RIFCSPHIGHO2_01_FULL_39_32]OGM38545.1 MAG: hypothetical protein A3F01_04285 [Candidatus Woesebacteria bacterium RIFCSPHIGHO2_12_FULL_38_11]OGM64971.1 MAG: hypothetical protein A2893_04935 [Candidatus Woesebacteria bacterium RIFCSPLOWO2_01_FULL_39_25]
MKLLAKLKIPFTIIVAGLLISVISGLIKIREISCENQNGECSRGVTQKFTEAKGLPYSSAKNKLTEMLQSNVAVKKYTIHFQIPAKLEVNIIESKPKYALKNSTSNIFSLVGEDGRVISQAESSDLPTLFVEKDLHPTTQTIDMETLFASEIVFSISNIHKFKSARLEGGKLIVEVVEGPTVIFPLEGDREILLGSYVLVTDELKKEGIGSTIKNPRIIDLRFKNPILKYVQK